MRQSTCPLLLPPPILPILLSVRGFHFFFSFFLGTFCAFTNMTVCVPNPTGEDKIVIRTGLLKGSEKWGKPAAEIYDKDRASWLPQTGDNSFPTVPPS